MTIDITTYPFLGRGRKKYWYRYSELSYKFNFVQSPVHLNVGPGKKGAW